MHDDKSFCKLKKGGPAYLARRLRREMNVPLVTDSTPLCIRLHGTAKTRTAGSEAALERKQAAAIAWIATQGPTPRSRLAGLLWPDVPEARARGNLRQSLSKLRQLSGHSFVVADGGMLALAEGVSVEPPAPGTQWLDAFSYDDCAEFSAWLDAERTARRSERRQALLGDIRSATQRGALDHALQRADELMALDSESEEAYRALMEVFYLRGDRAAAIGVWDRCRDMLRSLYGVLPSAATQRFGQTLLDSSPAAVLSAASAIPVTLLRPPRFVGRVGVVASLVAAWRVGRTICVIGEGGVGKSRLLGEFAAAVGSCAIVCARPSDAVLPYASLSRLVLAAINRFTPPLDDETVEWAVRLLPQIAEVCARPEPEPLRTAYERKRAIDGLSSLLGACSVRGCAAFVFDDLQFADRASVETLQVLVESGDEVRGPMPARLVLGSRDEELPAHAHALLASLESARCLVTVRLGALAEAEALELLRSLDLPGFDPERQAPRLRRCVGGNPAFLLESVKLVAALGQLGSVDQELPIPPGIEAVVERRLALLSPAARHVAELAAIAGESFSVALAGRSLARSLPELGEPLRELEFRQVLYGRQFVHDVVASAVRRSVPAAVAELLNRFVAEQLEFSAGEPAVVAGHWQACGEWRRAGENFLAAAAKERRAVRSAELVHMLDAAADAFGRCSAQAARFDALRERLLVSTAPDFMPTRKAQLERLEAEAQGEAQSLHALVARVSWHADHLQADTLAQAKDGLSRAQALGLDELAFDFAQAAAWLYAAKGDPVPALAVIDAQRDWAFAQDDSSWRVRFHIARSVTLAHADRLGEAIDEIEAGLTLLRAVGDPLQLLPLLGNLGLLRSWRGEFAAAVEVLSEATALRDRLHGRGTSLILDLYLGAALRDLGRYCESVAMLESAVAEYRIQLAADGELLTDLVIGEHHIAQLWLTLGRPDLAEAALVSDTATTEMRFRLRRTTLRLRIARVEGRRDERLVAELREGVDAVELSSARLHAELELLRAAPPELALLRLAEVCDAAALRERPGLMMHALTLRADVARRTGDTNQAFAAVRKLLELAERFMPFDIDPIEMWSTAYAVLAEAGDMAGADAAAHRGAQWRLSIRERGLPADARR